MLLKVWRFTTIILASLSMAMAFAHLLEMPPRMAWDAPLWIGATVTGNVFRLFGTIGAVVETSAWIAALVLAVLVRRHSRPVRVLVGLGAALPIIAFGIWWLFVFPVNAEIATWTPTAFPTDWSDWRAQWEYAHAARAVLLVFGLGALVASIIAEVPSGDARTEPVRGAASS